MKAVARLRKLSVSPRKVRLVTGLIKGLPVQQAMAVLQHTPKSCARYIEKLLLSAVANWEKKVGEESSEVMFVQGIKVDGAGMLKRIKPAPQGRAHRIRKRSSHITLVVEGVVSRENEQAQIGAAGKAKAKTTKDGTKS